MRGGDGIDGIVWALVLLRLCGFSGIVCGLPVNISLRMGILEEQDGAVVGRVKKKKNVLGHTKLISEELVHYSYLISVAKHVDQAWSGDS